MEYLSRDEIKKRRAFLLSILQGESGEDAKETQRELDSLNEMESSYKSLKS